MHLGFLTCKMEIIIIPTPQGVAVQKKYKVSGTLFPFENYGKVYITENLSS